MAPEVRAFSVLAAGPEFSSQNPHDGFQLSVTAVSEDPMPSFDIDTHKMLFYYFIF